MTSPRPLPCAVRWTVYGKFRATPELAVFRTIISINEFLNLVCEVYLKFCTRITPVRLLKPIKDPTLNVKCPVHGKCNARNVFLKVICVGLLKWCSKIARFRQLKPVKVPILQLKLMVNGKSRANLEFALFWTNHYHICVSKSNQCKIMEMVH